MYATTTNAVNTNTVFIMPSHYENRNIFEAAENDDEKSIKYFVEQEHVPVIVTDILNTTVAHIAAAHGQLNILKYLIEKDASLVEMGDRWNQTILHMATRKGALNMVEYLVDSCNASIHPLSHIFHSNNVLHIAAENGHLRVLQYYIEQKNMDVYVNERNDEGQPPVFLAAAHDHVHIVEYLMDDANADVMMVDNEQRTILHVCVDFGYRRVPQFFLDQRKLSFDLNARDIMGRSVLHSACLRQNTKFIKYLVEKKHADVNLTDNAGWTPLHQAANLSDYKLVEYFVQHGTGPKIADLQGRMAIDLTTDEQIIAYLKEAMQNRRRRNAIQPFVNSNLLWSGQKFVDVPKLGSSSLKPNLYNIHFGLILANIWVSWFKRSNNWQLTESLDSSLSTPGDILLSRINSIAAEIIYSISDKKF